MCLELKLRYATCHERGAMEKKIEYIIDVMKTNGYGLFESDEIMAACTLCGFLSSWRRQKSLGEL